MKDLRATEPDSEILASAVAQTLSEAAESLHAVGNLAAAKRQLEEADALLRQLPSVQSTRLNTTQFLLASNELRLARVILDETHASRGDARSLASLRNARTKFDTASKVFEAAAADRLLAGRELDERRARAEAGLRESETRIARLAGSAGVKASGAFTPKIGRDDRS